MYDFLAISSSDLAAWVAALAAVGLLLAGALGWLLSYILRTERRITESSIAELKAAVDALDKKFDSYFLDDGPRGQEN